MQLLKCTLVAVVHSGIDVRWTETDLKRYNEICPKNDVVVL